MVFNFGCTVPALVIISRIQNTCNRLVPYQSKCSDQAIRKTSRFPYTRSIFEKCLLLAVHDLYETPTDLWIPGVAGPKVFLSQLIMIEE